MAKGTASNRAEYMKSSDRTKMAGLKRDHSICLDKTGVRRPGKTAQDRARRGY